MIKRLPRGVSECVSAPLDGGAGKKFPNTELTGGEKAGILSAKGGNAYVARSTGRPSVESIWWEFA